MPYWSMGLILWFSSGAHSFRMRGQRPRTIADQSRCPNRVNLVVRTASLSLPVYPDEQTFSEFAGMSQTAE
jgi:hypothetical protein